MREDNVVFPVNIKNRIEDQHFQIDEMGLADKWQDIALCYRSLLHNYDGIYNGKKYEGFESGMLFEKLGIEPDWEKIRYYLLLDELF